MSNTIDDYTAATGIDATNDYLLIEQAVGPVYKKINQLTLLGIAGSPVGTTDSQTLSNKTIGNTNTVTLKDTLFTLEDDGDTTKKAQFQLSGITTGTTRTYTLPNASSTLADIATAQTLTNKTLTSPTISGGTIDNATITVDSISGHTVSTTVTVGGVQMNNGTIGTSGAVTSTSIATGAVQPQALVSGTGTGWATSPWTPTWTNLTVSGSTVTAKYIQIGKLVYFRLVVVLAGGNAPSGDVQFTLPVTSASYAGTTTVPVLGPARYVVTSSYIGSVVWKNTTTASLRVNNSSTTYMVDTVISATVPASFTNGSEIHAQGWYEAA